MSSRTKIKKLRESNPIISAFYKGVRFGMLKKRDKYRYISVESEIIDSSYIDFSSKKLKSIYLQIEEIVLAKISKRNFLEDISKIGKPLLLLAAPPEPKKNRPARLTMKNLIGSRVILASGKMKVCNKLVSGSQVEVASWSGAEEKDIENVNLKDWIAEYYNQRDIVTVKTANISVHSFKSLTRMKKICKFVGACEKCTTEIREKCSSLPKNGLSPEDWEDNDIAKILKTEN